MTQWLLDTFVWTGVLIALVLLVRRPVARHFGPQVAYALWALPLARFVLPPVVLPASFAPTTAETSLAMGNAAGFSLADPLLALWLGGAAVLLVWRMRDYLAMRRELLVDARPMGEAGPVRLVETPGVASPVAFGVRDKVVALPPGFMAQPDLAARDLAIAHELAHHRGHDLLANMAAQLLLALHWFNPLAWAGWRAMRSDQEAACDARVIAGCDRPERAAYAQVIAGFAAGPRLSLAAPMACPVLGEKSIIHRLRSLTLDDVPATRRKLGLGVIATSALLALPLTASISYARPERPAVPRLAEKAAVPDQALAVRVVEQTEPPAAVLTAAAAIPAPPSALCASDCPAKPVQGSALASTSDLAAADQARLVDTETAELDLQKVAFVADPEEPANAELVVVRLTFVVWVTPIAPAEPAAPLEPEPPVTAIALRPI